MPNEIQEAPSPRITIPGDTLVTDEAFCDEVLAGAHRKTANRYEAEGLPFAMPRLRTFSTLSLTSAISLSRTGALLR